MIPETVKQRDPDIPVPLVHGVLVIDLSGRVDDRGWLDGEGLSAIPFVPAGVAVDLRIGEARFVDPLLAARLATTHLRQAGQIVVAGRHPDAIATLVANLRKAMTIADPSWLVEPAHDDPWAAA